MQPYKYLSILLLSFLSTQVICQSFTSKTAKQPTQLVWSDEFNYKGLPDSTKWNYDIGGWGWGNNEFQYYTKAALSNARVGEGVLTIELKKENIGDKKYSSARLVTKGKGDWIYGRIDVRAKLPKGLGTWPAIL